MKKQMGLLAAQQQKFVGKGMPSGFAPIDLALIQPAKLHKML